VLDRCGGWGKVGRRMSDDRCQMRGYVIVHGLWAMGCGALTVITFAFSSKFVTFRNLKRTPMRSLIGFCLLLVSFPTLAQSSLSDQLDHKAAAIEQKVIEWRRDFHQHPALGNEEVRTAGIVAKHLKGLGMEVEEGVAVTGVVGLLKGGKPGPTVALRADMDGLPVTERVDVPFKSQVTTVYNGQEIGVMHACGHDSHVAILMGVAEILASVK